MHETEYVGSPIEETVAKALSSHGYEPIRNKGETLYGFIIVALCKHFAYQPHSKYTVPKPD